MPDERGPFVPTQGADQPERLAQVDLDVLADERWEGRRDGGRDGGTGGTGERRVGGWAGPEGRAGERQCEQNLNSSHEYSTTPPLLFRPPSLFRFPSLFHFPSLFRPPSLFCPPSLLWPPPPFRGYLVDADGHGRAEAAGLAGATQVQEEDVVAGLGEKVGRRAVAQVPREAVLAEPVDEQDGAARPPDEADGALARHGEGALLDRQVVQLGAEPRKPVARDGFVHDRGLHRLRSTCPSRRIRHTRVSAEAAA